MHKRIELVDISKGILILLVVLGHSGFPFTSIIYLFHMVAFVYLSGITFNGIDFNLLSFIKKKIKHLYVPYVVIQTIFIVLSNYFIELSIMSGEKLKIFEMMRMFFSALTFGGGGGELSGAMWYIPMIFFCHIIYAIIYHFKINYGLKDNTISLIIMLIFYVGVLSINMNINFPRHIDTALLVIPFFHLGTMMRQKEILHINKYLFVFLLPLLFSLGKMGSINIGTHTIINPIFFLVVSMVGILILLSISNFIENVYVKRMFIYLGRKTLIIMCFHFLSFKILDLYYFGNEELSLNQLVIFPFSKKDNFYWLPYTVVGLLLPLFFDKIVRMITSKVRGILSE